MDCISVRFLIIMVKQMCTHLYREVIKNIHNRVALQGILGLKRAWKVPCHLKVTKTHQPLSCIYCSPGIIWCPPMCHCTVCYISIRDVTGGMVSVGLRPDTLFWSIYAGPMVFQQGCLMRIVLMV